MKKADSYVTQGLPTALTAQPCEEDEFVAGDGLNSSMSPADLPRDAGLNISGTAAKEIPTLRRAVALSFEAFREQLADQPLEKVNAILDTLLAPSDRHRLKAESIGQGTLTLSLASSADRFSMNRFVIPKLKKQLAAEFGALRINLMVPKL
ncbi:MAG: hypothetical protein RSD41_03015 [Kiritimatiellia bacterium]